MTTRVKAAKAFDYAHDGIKSKRIDDGADVDIHDELVAGFVRDGLICDPATGKPAPADKAAKAAPETK